MHTDRGWWPHLSLCPQGAAARHPGRHPAPAPRQDHHPQVRCGAPRPRTTTPGSAATGCSKLQGTALCWLERRGFRVSGYPQLDTPVLCRTLRPRSLLAPRTQPYRNRGSPRPCCGCPTTGRHAGPSSQPGRQPPQRHRHPSFPYTHTPRPTLRLTPPPAFTGTCSPCPPPLYFLPAAPHLSVIVESYLIAVRNAAATGERGMLGPMLRRWHYGSCTSSAFGLPVVQVRRVRNGR